jgi:DGQHR domain-containing protein
MITNQNPSKNDDNKKQNMDLEPVDIKRVIDWYRYLSEMLTENIRNKSAEIASLADELDEFTDECDKFSVYDANKGVDILTRLKQTLQDTTFKGKGAGTRDKIVKEIILPNGWQYYIPESPNDIFNDLSTPRGNDIVQYKSIEASKILGRWEGAGGIELLKGANETLDWTLTEFTISDDVNVLIGSIPAWELDLCSTLPALEKKLSHYESSKRVLDSKRKSKNWQRRRDKSKIKSIASFVDKEMSFFANPVILHLPNQRYVEISKQKNLSSANLTISLAFAGNEDSLDNTSFNKRFEDQRPFTIIDGSHRINGTASSIDTYNQKLLVVILPPEVTEDVAGRLFAEINTLSDPLNDKQRMFLAHRFRVTSPDPKFTFGNWTTDDINTHRDRANRMAYEMASKLMLNPDSDFWFERIKLLNENVKKQQVIGIEKFVEYSYDWFLGYPYTVNNLEIYDEDLIFSEVDNYFEAWGEIIGKAWEESKVDHCLFKSKTQSRVILSRFQQVHAKANELSDGSGLTKQNFLDVLAPLKNIPFTDETILDAFSTGLPEASWKHLDAWVNDAIEVGTVHSTSDILNKDIRGVPGAGILSLPPENDGWYVKVDEESDGLDPSDGNTRYLTVRRPPNCGYTCKPEIWHNDAKLNTKISVTAKLVEFEGNIPIRDRYPLSVLEGSVTLRIIWSTISGEEYTEICIK